MCDMSTNVADVVWRGREAIRYGPLPYCPREPHLGDPPGMDYGVPPRMRPAAGCHQSCQDMYLHVTRPPKQLALCGAAGRPSGMTCYPPVPTTQGVPARCPTWHGLPAPPPGMQLDADWNHGQKCILVCHSGQGGWGHEGQPGGRLAVAFEPTAQGVRARSSTWHGLSVPPRMHLDADCPGTMAGHVCMSDTSVRGVGATRGSQGAENYPVSACGTGDGGAGAPCKSG